MELSDRNGQIEQHDMDVAKRLERIRSFTALPVGVGFGIRDGQTAHAIAQVADAVVIGSRLVQEIESAPADAPAKVQAFMADIRAAMDAGAKQ